MHNWVFSKKTLSNKQIVFKYYWRVLAASKEQTLFKSGLKCEPCGIPDFLHLKTNIRRIVFETKTAI